MQVINAGVSPARRIPADHVWFPDPAQPAAYDEDIRTAGGIDLFLIATGASDGHVAFNPPGDASTRGEDIIAIEEQIFAEARDEHTTGKPAALSHRGGGGYANITFRFMQAITLHRGDELVCTVPNQGAVAEIEAEAGVEIVCTVDRTGPHPLPVGPIPPAFRGLVQAVKAYETLTVEAAVQQSRTLAIQALLNHPLVGDLPTTEALVDELLTAHGLRYT